MTTATDVHPSLVLDGLLSKGGRSHRQANLKRLHELCEARHAKGSRDFSTSSIGKLLEADGVMLGRALYNKVAADYRELIAAWAAYAGPPPAKAPRLSTDDEMLSRIDDPAIRSIFGSLMAENKKLKAQVEVLRNGANVLIDRRPLIATPPSPAVDGVTVLSMSSQFTRSEREALEGAIDVELLERHGLREGSHGEILNKQGRAVFDVGFTRAIRKVLGEQAP